jgi:hypothetical protein
MGNSADPLTVNLDNFVTVDSLLLPRQIRYQRNMPITVLTKFSYIFQMIFALAIPSSSFCLTLAFIPISK